ncbi:MAG: electron transfer flavoprotein subunit alpha/FixB family protein [Syntrophales bacterium]|nr:electron transfer flavoprotein subunit alpha/FixB family protein [Syntrophales bacterium]
MAGVWIFSEDRRLVLEMLHIGRRLNDAFGSAITVFTPASREETQVFFEYGAHEVVILPPLPEKRTIRDYAVSLADEAERCSPNVFLFGSTYIGREMAARVAARLKAGLCSNCIHVECNRESGTIIMERYLYGGMAIQRLVWDRVPIMATVPPRVFPSATPLEAGEGTVRELLPPPASSVKVLTRKIKPKETRDITGAKVIVAAGRGVEKKEDLDLVQKLADSLGGELACTRPLAEELNWLPAELCIGLSGVTVKPELYVGVGVSGQVQHMTGVRNAKVICAINKDQNAPIFTQADLGIVGDLYDVLPKLIEALRK